MCRAEGRSGGVGLWNRCVPCRVGHPTVARVEALRAGCTDGYRWRTLKEQAWKLVPLARAAAHQTVPERCGGGAGQRQPSSGATNLRMLPWTWAVYATPT